MGLLIAAGAGSPWLGVIWVPVRADAFLRCISLLSGRAVIFAFERKQGSLSFRERMSRPNTVGSYEHMSRPLKQHVQETLQDPPTCW